MTAPTPDATPDAPDPGTPTPPNLNPTPATPPRWGTPVPPSAPTPGAPPATAAAPAATAAPRRSPAERNRRVRKFLAVLAVLLAGGIVTAALTAGTRHGYLDPRSADPSGSRALAELLQDRGVTTRVVTTAREAAAAAGPGTTLLVTAPDRLGAGRLSALRSATDLAGGRTVLLAPSGPSLPVLAPGVRTSGEARPDVLAPDCALPAALSAGRAATGSGLSYATLPGATACYPAGGHPTLLVLPPGTTGAGSTGETVLLGSEAFLLNEHLAEQGNASLALQLLGSRPELVWYLPSLADSDPETAADGEEQSFFELLPAGWSWALLQLLVAGVLAALWRARRLGPLVTERLPVVVRASEATEGRARLYRKAGARDRAATVLRAATRERLAALLGVPPTRAHDPATLVPAVSARLTPAPEPQQRPEPRPRDVNALLFGTTPSDDAALVALADHLDALEREVRTS
ncbi:hypothetical protein GCM10010371_40200 [Streptomyces subrutilus]|uniref:DUF4350 domain-containing protein n=1 Tax=Streptomyces subrutilus TaxID=36818 RepID=A0A918QY88_9ACTN|nr:hypothetical protein GCM10010371_40200 [Streptomyces subrutilus]